MSTEFALFYTTCPDTATAENISKTLLQEKLVACTNIYPVVHSHYWWEGQIESSKECVLILKSKTQLKSDLQKRFESLHPYQTACFLEIPIQSGNLKYLNWLEDSLK